MSTTNTSVKAELPGGITVTVDIPGDGGASGAVGEPKDGPVAWRTLALEATGHRKVCSVFIMAGMSPFGGDLDLYAVLHHVLSLYGFAHGELG